MHRERGWFIAQHKSQESLHINSRYYLSILVVVPTLFLTSKETVQNTAKNKSVCTFTMLGLECWSIGREL